MVLCTLEHCNKHWIIYIRTYLAVHKGKPTGVPFQSSVSWIPALPNLYLVTFQDSFSPLLPIYLHCLKNVTFCIHSGHDGGPASANPWEEFDSVVTFRNAAHQQPINDEDDDTSTVGKDGEKYISENDVSHVEYTADCVLKSWCNCWPVSIAVWVNWMQWL